MILDPLLVEFGITGLSEAETDALNRAWHRLRPWPDAVAGPDAAEEASSSSRRSRTATSR